MLKKLNNLNPAGKMLIAFIAIVLGLSFLFAPKPHPIDLSVIGFNTTSSSDLYFKNVRSFYYDISPREKAPFTLYRLKRRNFDTLHPDLQFMIIRNPLADQAYIFAEASPALKQYDSLSVLITDESDSTRVAVLGEMNNEDHYLFAAAVFKKLLEGGKTYALNQSDTITEIFNTERERKNAETVLEDYFKLVNKN